MMTVLEESSVEAMREKLRKPYNLRKTWAADDHTGDGDELTLQYDTDHSQPVYILHLTNPRQQEPGMMYPIHFHAQDVHISQIPMYTAHQTQLQMQHGLILYW